MQCGLLCRAPECLQKCSCTSRSIHPALNVLLLVQVFEYMESDLEALIKDRALILSEADVKSYMQMLLRALEVCHRHWVLHRDIKPNNFLIAASGPRLGHVHPNRACCPAVAAAASKAWHAQASGQESRGLQHGSLRHAPSARGSCWPNSHDMRTYAWLLSATGIRL